MLEAQDLVVTYPGAAAPALDGVSLAVQASEFTGIIGPNGSGKTTLLRALSRVLAPARGQVRLLGRDLRQWRPLELARRLAVVAQDQPSHFDFSVEEMVLMGRFAHLRPWRGETSRDLAAARQAMARCGVAHLAQRRWAELSGGERQRAVLARALCQEPRVLLLDEPTTHLDIHHQVAVLDLAAGLNADGVTVLAVLHDLNLAALYCRRLILLDRGRVVADGPPPDVLVPDLLQAVYGGEALVAPHPSLGVPQVFLMPKRSVAAGRRSDRAEV